ncbi:MAG TPA: heat-inducible transcription repressor HrcA [Elusimicrobia bacterium]|nr:heat-inducible transcription repressor HrcA [Elusimicrobiota bacterium]
MRQLDPQIAQDRKRRVLQWVVQNYIHTSRPIASSIIAEEAGLDLSSATIRSILSELEQEGYLVQPHTSAGRVPTDRGYRFFVDYLENVQRLASGEKEQIEKQYCNRLEELDRVLAHTSRLLSTVSHSAGLVLSPRSEAQGLKRLELIGLGGNRVLAIIVTKAGQVRHWPLQLSFVPNEARLRALNRFLNEHLEGKSIREVRSLLAEQLEQAEREMRELQDFAHTLLGELESAVEPDELFLDGATSVVARAEEFEDTREIHSLVRVLEERKVLADMLQEQFRKQLDAAKAGGAPTVRVMIGGENTLPELKHLSLVTTTYCAGDRLVGLLGILGTKRMEYSRMMSLVEYMGRIVSRSLEAWDVEPEGKPKRIPR